MCLFICILVYTVVLVLSISALMAEDNLKTSSDCVKVIFWPITVVVFVIGMILLVLIWAPRKLFKGILLCLYEIKDFFIKIFYCAIEDED